MSETICFEGLPSGLTTRSGGTRRLTKDRLSRSWQQPLPSSGECPFCNPTIPPLSSPSGWKVIRNASMNYDRALLLIPNGCNPGLENICHHFEESPSVLDVARSVMSERDTWLGLQVGNLAGGSVLHPHYHLLEPEPSNGAGVERTAGFFRQQHRENGAPKPLFTQSEVVAVAGGSKAGQCLIFSLNGGPVPYEITAKAVGAILRVYAERFQNQQGLPPEYKVGVAFVERKIQYATVVPVLTQAGFADDLAILEGRALPMGWTHSETTEFILGES